MRIVRLLVSVVMVMPMTLGGIASAQEASTPTQIVDNPPVAQNIQSRIKARKEKSQRRLSQLESRIVKPKCQTASTLIKQSQPRVNNFASQRTRLYSQTVDRLRSFSPKLKSANLDTATYDSQIARLQTKFDSFSSEVSAFKQAVDDLVAMDCSTDPEGFVITLLDAKARRLAVIEKGKDFRAYIKDTIKPTLVSFRSQLNTQTEGQ